MGITSYKAEANARKSLGHTKKQGKKDIYLLDENDVLEGPLSNEERLRYSIISNDENLIDVGEKTGLGVGTLAKILAFSDIRKSKVYDSKELAECLGVTERSARRILGKIVNSGYGKIYAKESTGNGGRPRILTELLF
jgi:hypothetical protein